jgi:anaerobic selenocysteine-containing dehydrogenase
MPTHTESNRSSGTKPAIGFGPNRGGDFSQEDYHHPAAGWGAAISVSKVLISQGELIDGTRAVFKMNHENGGYDCPGCAWPDDRKGLRMDICENGIKHATWEMTRKLVERDFFATHTVKELMGWTDYALEAAGRLTEPMRYDTASDKYVPVSWDEAFELASRHIRGLEHPNQAAFYTSGRLSNEATFLYQLFARELGPTIFRIARTCVTRRVAEHSVLRSAPPRSASHLSRCFERSEPT